MATLAFYSFFKVALYSFFKAALTIALANLFLRLLRSKGQPHGEFVARNIIGNIFLRFLNFILGFVINFLNNYVLEPLFAFIGRSLKAAKAAVQAVIKGALAVVEQVATKGKEAAEKIKSTGKKAGKAAEKKVDEVIGGLNRAKDYVEDFITEDIPDAVQEEFNKFPGRLQAAAGDAMAGGGQQALDAAGAGIRQAAADAKKALVSAKNDAINSISDYPEQAFNDAINGIKKNIKNKATDEIKKIPQRMDQLKDDIARELRQFFRIDEILDIGNTVVDFIGGGGAENAANVVGDAISGGFNNAVDSVKNFFGSDGNRDRACESCGIVDVFKDFRNGARFFMVYGMGSRRPTSSRCTYPTDWNVTLLKPHRHDEWWGFDNVNDGPKISEGIDILIASHNGCSMKWNVLRPDLGRETNQGNVYYSQEDMKFLDGHKNNPLRALPAEPHWRLVLDLFPPSRHDWFIHGRVASKDPGRDQRGPVNSLLQDMFLYMIVTNASFRDDFLARKGEDEAQEFVTDFVTSMKLILIDVDEQLHYGRKTTTKKIKRSHQQTVKSLRNDMREELEELELNDPDAARRAEAGVEQRFKSLNQSFRREVDNTLWKVLQWRFDRSEFRDIYLKDGNGYLIQAVRNRRFFPFDAGW